MIATDKDRRFKTSWYHHKPRHWLRRPARATSMVRPFLECIHLPAVADVATQAAGALPPVRLFLGTESAHYRAERVFVWSVMQVRNPARAYEIHLMKDLPGFRRDDWKTGFTKYRYAIPQLTAGTGRAIYNDVDQFYLRDPGELFDLDMEDAGVLSVTPRDNSVMLIDCEKMSRCWPRADVYSDLRHQRLRERAQVEGRWRALDGQWNARDGEYPLADAWCRHFTTLHWQPWQPFPAQLSYRDAPDAEAWCELERAADDAGFTLFTAAQPSRHYSELGRQYEQVHNNDEAISAIEPARPFDGRRLPRSARAVAELIEATGARSVLDYGAGQGSNYTPAPGEPATSRLRTLAAWPGVRVICYDPGYAPFATPWEEAVDGVVSTDVIEHVPDNDVPWVLNEIFRRARKFVYVLAACYPARMILPNGENAHCTVQPPAWWRGQMALVARRYPQVRWTLACEEKGLFGKKRTYFSAAARSAPG